MQTTNQENNAVDDLQERLRSNVESIQMLNHQVILMVINLYNSGFIQKL